MFSWFRKKADKPQEAGRQLLEKLNYIGKETAEQILQTYGTVTPFGIVLDHNGNPITHSPKKSELSDTSDTFGSMVELVLDYLQQAVDHRTATAIAIVTELESEGNKGFAVQAEIPGTVSLLIYPCEKRGDKWSVGDPFQDNGGAILFDDNAFPFWNPKSKRS